MLTMHTASARARTPISLKLRRILIDCERPLPAYLIYESNNSSALTAYIHMLASLTFEFTVIGDAQRKSPNTSSCVGDTSAQFDG